MTRSMTAAEKMNFKGLFPMLNVDAAVVSGEATEVYNCIAWTVGVTDKWLWPGASIASFDTFYRQWGFARTNNGPIAAWGSSTSAMTHGCISGSGHGARWESKCGQSLRIQHGLTELEGSSYGRVVAFYSESTTAAPFAELMAKSAKTKDKRAMKLTSSQMSLLKESVAGVPKDLQLNFESAFSAWKKTWFEGGLAINSDPHSRARGKDFDVLVSLGPSTLPLVVQMLAHEENFFALVLYDVLQSDARLVVQYEADDPRILRGEQGRAAAVVKVWLAR